MQTQLLARCVGSEKKERRKNLIDRAILIYVNGVAIGKKSSGITAVFFDSGSSGALWHLEINMF